MLAALALRPRHFAPLRCNADRTARAQTSLIEFDKATYGEEWLWREKRNFAVCGGLHLIWFFVMVRCHAHTSLLALSSAAR